MATLKIEITMDGAAFGEIGDDPEIRTAEVNRILRETAHVTVYVDGMDRPLFDSNGNRVGFIRVEP